MFRFKRLLSVLLAVLMCLGAMPITGFATTTDGFDNFANRNAFNSDIFTDVSESDWFYADVKAVYELGLMLGKGANTFDTESGVTIAEAITIAARIHSIYTNGSDAFEAGTPWYQVYVDYAAKEGIFTEEVKDFAKPATRAEFVTVLANAMPDEALEAINKVAADAIPDVKADVAYGEAVYKLYRAGIMTGNDEKGTFAPDSEIKRSEVAAVTARMANKDLRKTVKLGEEYTVTFDMNGHGEKIDDQTIFEGETAEKPENPAKDNSYVFKGWYTEKDGGKEYDFKTPVTEDITLYARWEKDNKIMAMMLALIGGGKNKEVTFTVAFDSNGGTAVESQEVKAGKLATEPAAPTKDGFTFAGWYSDEELTTAYDFATPVTADIVLYAKWADSSATYVVTFDSNGGTSVESQIVNAGETATAPTAPEKEGYAFAGWYTGNDQTKYDDYYTFSTPVTANTVLYAKWIDMTDTDGDGLVDGLEDYYGTDKTVIDTDGDGLNDYVEVTVLNLNPLKIDSDDNGTNDGDEDNDGDGITNAVEIANGTNPVFKDTDIDGLDDNEEIVYGTDALVADTDDDGVSDGKEVELGTDPLVAEATFNMNVVAENNGEGATASVQIELSGEQVETLSVLAVDNDTFFPETMPGYMGQAYDFNVEGEFDVATISFEFDASTLAPDADPVIYYFDEENQTLEELVTTVNGNVASAEVTHFSKYILVDRTIYEDSFKWIDVWDSDKNYTGVEIVLIIDDSGSMQSNDRYNERLTVAKDLIDKLPANSKVGVVRFETNTTNLTSVITDDKEYAKSFLTTNYFYSYGGTYMYKSIDNAFSLFETTAEDVMKVMVVLSDGDTSDTHMHNQIVTKANDNSVKIYTVGLGTGSTYYFNSYLKPLATNTDGKFYLASDASQLADIYKDISEKIDIETDSDYDGIPDYYEDNMVAFNGVKLVLDKNNPDTDGDGLPDGEEVKITKPERVDDTKVKVTGRMLSDPTKKDTDGDGLSDKEDPKPMRFNVTDRHLAMFAKLSYSSKDVSNNTSFNDSLGYASINELDGWQLVDQFVGTNSKGEEKTFAANTYQNTTTKEVVVAFRGSDDTWDWLGNFVLYPQAGMSHPQSILAEAYINGTIKKYSSNIYITGHSLGGYLAAYAVGTIDGDFKRCVIFNGLGMDLTAPKNIKNNLKANKAKITNYRVEGDVVSKIGTHYGQESEFIPNYYVLKEYGLYDLNWWDYLGKMQYDFILATHDMRNFFTYPELGNRY